jgi:hypothetical protein
MTHAELRQSQISSPAAPGLRAWFAFVATVVGLGAIIYAASGAAETLGLVDAGRNFLFFGAILGGFLLPAAIVTIHIVARVGATPWVGRALLGMVSWIGWYLFVAAMVVMAGTIGIWPEGFGFILVLLAVAGAVFAVLGLSSHQATPRPIVTILAAVIGSLIIAGCFVTVGWWG